MSTFGNQGVILTSDVGVLTTVSTGINHSKSVSSYNDILLLVVIICVITLCITICIFILCMYDLNKNKNCEIQRKQIALDNVINKEKQLNDNKDNIKKNNNNMNAIPIQLGKIQSLSRSNDIVNNINFGADFVDNDAHQYQQGEADIEIVDINGQDIDKFDINRHDNVDNDESDIEELFDHNNNGKTKQNIKVVIDNGASNHCAYQICMM